MHENIRAIVASDEAVTFRVIEPFYGATQFIALPTQTYLFPFMAGCTPSRPKPEIARSLAERARQSTKMVEKPYRKQLIM